MAASRKTTGKSVRGTVRKTVKKVGKTVKKAVRRTVKRVAPKGAKKATLSRKQVAQRKYAGSMAGVRKRAAASPGGKGPVAKRASATQLRRKLGLSPGA